MTTHHSTRLSATARTGLFSVLAAVATPALADTVLSGNYSIAGGLCVGASCAYGETYDSEEIAKLRGDEGVGLKFDDIGSTQTGGPMPTPYPDWMLVANHSLSFSFGIQDLSTSNLVFRVSAGAPASALTIAGSNVGFGTMMPQRDLHVVNGDTPALRLDQDTSGGQPAQVWDLMADETMMGFGDITGSATPFAVEAGAPTNALYAAQSGKVGFGTATPQTSLHVVSAAAPALRLEQDNTLFTPYIWQLVGREVGFYISDKTSNTTPLYIMKGAPDNAIRIHTSGDISIGAPFYPTSTLQLYRTDGTAQLAVREANATVQPRTLLNLQNNGRPEIVMGNSSTGGEWSFGAGTNFVLKQGPAGSASSAKTKLFEIKSTGDATLAGTLVTGGTTCGTGCDAVFAPDYPLPSIAEHSAQMRALGYLPNVGPTPEGAPLNVTDKLGRMLNELEHAHLYIARQQDALATEQARTRDQAALIARLSGQVEGLTARLDALEGAGGN